MTKKIMALVIILGLLFQVFAVYAVKEISAYMMDFKIYVNDKLQNFNMPIVTIDGRTYLPLRETAETLGIDIEWVGEKDKIMIKDEREPLKNRYLYFGENHEFNVTEEHLPTIDWIFEQGCLKDEETAIQVARTILKSMYGEDFDNGLDLIVEFDEKEELWLIRSQLPDDDNLVGGYKHIILRKSNAEVVAVWGTV